MTESISHELEGEIPDERDYEKKVTCPITHPGLCRFEHRLIWTVLARVAEGVLSFAQRADDIGKFCEITGTNAMNRQSLYLYLADRRGARPRVAAFIVCNRVDDDPPVLTLMTDASGQLERMYQHNVAHHFITHTHRQRLASWPSGSGPRIYQLR